MNAAKISFIRHNEPRGAGEPGITIILIFLRNGMSRRKRLRWSPMPGWILTKNAIIGKALALSGS